MLGGNWKIDHDEQIWSLRDSIERRVGAQNWRKIKSSVQRGLEANFDKSVILQDVNEVLINSFDLQPAGLWRQALGDRYSKSKGANFFISDELKRLEREVSSGSLSHKDSLRVAIFLLYDIWLYLHHGYSDVKGSPILDLARNAKISSFPAIKISLALRNAALGSMQDSLFFEDLLKNGDSKISEIFDRAYFFEMFSCVH
jgi:hypothetical protein